LKNPDKAGVLASLQTKNRDWMIEKQPSYLY